jgi:hypothetical protein
MLAQKKSRLSSIVSSSGSRSSGESMLSAPKGLWDCIRSIFSSTPVSCCYKSRSRLLSRMKGSIFCSIPIFFSYLSYKSLSV